MTDLLAQWLDDRVPGVDPADLDRFGIPFRAAQMIGGVRQGKNGAWIVGVFADPPSCWHWIDEVVLDDLVVFHPARPERFRTVYGSGVAVLGEGQLDRARFRPLSDTKHASLLRVFRDPLSWMRAAGGGVCPLDMPAFARSVVGYGDLELIGEDKQHAMQIKRAVTAAAKLAIPKFRIAA